MAADAIASVFAGSTVPAEIIVVDQGDRPFDPADLFVPPGVELRRVRDPGRGASRARNRGVAEARGQWILFLDDDVRVAPEWCAALLSALRAARPDDAVAGRVVAGPPERPGAFTPSVEDRSQPMLQDVPGDRDLLGTLNAGIARATLVRLGGFDERLGPGTAFPAAEDNDLGRRLLRAGGRILFEPTAEVIHRSWRPARRRAQLRYQYGRGQGAFYAKHALSGDAEALARAGRDAARMLRRAVRRAREGHQPRDELAYVVGMILGFAGWSARASGSGRGGIE
jgi:GT2 family glycosyltransferase